MKVRSQILLAVLPLFAVLGLVAAVIHHSTRLNEISTERIDQAKTLATSISEFLLSSSGFESELHESDGQIDFALDQIQSNNSLSGIWLIDPSSGTPVWPPGAENWDYPGSFSLTESSDAEGILVSELLGSVEEGFKTWAIVPVPGGEGITALLVLSLDGSSYHERRRALMRESLILGLVPLFFGALLSFALSHLLSRSIHRLAETATVLSSGQFGPKFSGGRFRELNELGNTLETMGSVLEETLTRTRQSLVEGEQFRTRRELGQTLAESLWSPVVLEERGVQLAAGRLGSASGGNLLATAGNGDILRVVMARLLGEGELEPMLDASAARMLILQELQLDLEAHGFRHAMELFNFHSWCSVRWKKGSRELEVWNYRFGRQEPRWERVSLEQRNPLVIHFFEGDLADKIDLYANLSNGAEAGQLLSELTTIFDQPEEGGLVVLSSPVHSEETIQDPVLPAEPSTGLPFRPSTEGSGIPYRSAE